MENTVKDQNKEKLPTVAIHFSEKLVSEPFTSNGKSFVSISVPSQDKPWPSFVVPEDKVYNDKNGHGKYTYLIENASVTLKKSVEKGVDQETGKKTYEKVSEKISVKELKERFNDKEKSKENEISDYAKQTLDKVSKQVEQDTNKGIGQDI